MRPGSMLAVAASAAALLVATGVRAEDVPPMREEARVLLAEGMARFDAGDFAGAAEKFRDARAIDPHRDLAYAEAQAQRRGGHCDAAIPLYEAFLAAGPPEAEAELARANLDRCKSAPSSTDPPRDPAGESATLPPAPEPPPPPLPLAPLPVAPEPRVAAGEPTRREARAAEAPRPVVTLGSDVWFWTALAAGAVTTGVGGGLLIASDGEADAANEAPTLDAFVDARGAHEDLATAGTVVVAVGGTFLVAAAVRAIWVGATPTSSPVTARAGAIAFALPLGS